MDFLQALENRRSFYHLGKNTKLTQKEIITVIKHCLKHTPANF